MYISNVANTTSLTAIAKASAGSATDKNLEKACQEFEAIFLSIIWKEMQKSTGTDLGGWDAITDQALGQSWAKSGGIGLAKVIARQMSKHLY